MLDRSSGNKWADPCTAGRPISIFWESMSRPTNIVAGDTYTWQVSCPDYPASDGWALKVTITNVTIRKQIDAATASDGKSFDVTLPSATSDDLTVVGPYTITEVVWRGTGASLERHTVYTGTVNVTADMTTSGTAADLRTHARKVLEAIEAAIEGRATRGQLDTTVIGDRQVKYLAPGELLKWRSFYSNEVKREEAAARIAQGLDGGNRMVVRFGSSWK